MRVTLYGYDESGKESCRTSINHGIPKKTLKEDAMNKIEKYIEYMYSCNYDVYFIDGTIGNKHSKIRYKLCRTTMIDETHVRVDYYDEGISKFQ
jgi:hypothetical protein